jgi:hypothetical protein
MRSVALVLSAACILGCGQPADAPKAVGSVAGSGAVDAKPSAFVGHFPQDCEDWPYGESLKAELTEKAFGLLEGLQSTRTKALLERIHPDGLRLVQTLADPQTGLGDKRETGLPRSEVLQHFAEGGGAWLLDGFIDPIRSFRRLKVGAHWDILDGNRQLCVGVGGTVGLFDGMPYVVVQPTEDEENEGQNTAVIVLFDRDSRGTWLVAAVVRSYQPVE